LTVRIRPGWIGVVQAFALSLAFGLIGFVLYTGLIAGYVAIGSSNFRAGLAQLGTAGGVQILVQGVILLVAFLVATALVARWMLGWTFRDLRWARGRTAVSGAIRGLGLGAATAAVTMGVGVLLRAAVWSPDQGGLGEYVTQVWKTIAVLAPAALSEEVMFRGVPLVLLAGVLGRTPALVVVAGLTFSLAHVFNPNITPLAFLNIALAGLFLGVVFYGPGGIWASWGAHLGWNAALAALDAPVSGLPFRIPFLDYHAGNPAWVSGGSFGPEGGVLATLALLGALLVARRWARQEPA